MKNILIGVAVVLSVVSFGFNFLAPKPQAPVGATPGGDFFAPVTVFEGMTNATNISTTTGGSLTINAADIRGWSKASMVSLIPNTVSAMTITFPASSTLNSIVPKAGDRQTFCLRNATTTSAIYMTLAGGTGVNLLVASSSATALGGTKLLSGKVGCITLVRQIATATTFDIDALLTVYQ